MRCQKCHTERAIDPCFKCGSALTEPCAGWEELRLPPIEPIREACRLHGYALAVHGSQERDLDVVAVPWTDDAVGNHDLIQAVATALDAHIVEITRKPFGRYAASLQMRVGWYKIIDLSVAPKLEPVCKS